MNRYEDMKSEIEEIRKRLNLMLENGADSEQIIAVSTELDKKIVEFMNNEKK